MSRRVPADRTRSAFRRRAVRMVPATTTLAIVIAVWYSISYGTMDEFRRAVVLPPPHRVIIEGFLTWDESRGLRPILESLLVTARVAASGLFLSCVIGSFVGYLMHRSIALEKALFPYAVIIQTTPILVLVPLIKVWFGSDLTSRTIACTLIGIFPMITHSHFGFRSIDPELHDLFTMGRATRQQRLVKLELPSALPSIFAGMKVSSGACVIGAIVGDFFFLRGSIGIGRLIDNFHKDARTTELLAAAIISSLFGVAIFVVISSIANRVLRDWHASEHDGARSSVLG